MARFRRSPTRVSLARKLVEGRIEAGLSRAELARRAGVRAETVSRIRQIKLSHTAHVANAPADRLKGIQARVTNGNSRWRGE